MAKLITIRVYEELNDFIHHSRRKKAFSFSFTGKRTIKDIIESLGIPHTEVDLILANGNSVTFPYCPEPEDYISVYPVFELLDIASVTRLRPEPLRETRFILDVHLGTLARYLRMAGFDCYYRNNLEDEEIIRIALEQKRLILTRDLPMLKNGKVTHGYFVRATNPLKQLHEIVGRFDLRQKLDPFTRCLECNGTLEKTDREAVKTKVRPKTLLYFDEYYRCQSCGKIYWKGSHHRKMEQMMDVLR